MPRHCLVARANADTRCEQGHPARIECTEAAVGLGLLVLLVSDVGDCKILAGRLELRFEENVDPSPMSQSGSDAVAPAFCRTDPECNECRSICLAERMLISRHA